MPLATGQWQVRDLVLGPGTDYGVEQGANPFTMTVRADQGGPRAWNHGTWSGAEWANERVVPLRVLVESTSTTGWLAAFQQLVAAFAPVGDAVEQVELRFEFAGNEFLLFGRPRMVEPDTSLVASFSSLVRLAFVAQDPRIYSGVEQLSEPIILPVQGGGLLIPTLVPFIVGGTLFGGEATLLNEGTTNAGLALRVDGPVADPAIILTRPDGTIQEIRFDLTLLSGQWIDIDTAARTAFLNGLPTSSVRGLAAWSMDPYPLPPGSSLIRFRASDEAAGTLTVTWRSAWW